MKTYFVIGSSNVDLVMHMPRLPAVGETIINATFSQTYGGKGANTAVATQRAGGQVRFINCVGDDAYTPAMLEMYKAEGIDIDLVSRESGIASGTAFVIVGQNGENYLTVASGANNLLTPDRIDALEAEIATADRILLQCEIPPATNTRVIEIAERYRIPVLLNLAPARAMAAEDLQKVDALVVNEVEGRFLADEAGLTYASDEQLARLLRNHYASLLVVVTLGEEGAVAATADEDITVPAFKVEVVDTVAAGDTFCGAFAVALTEGRDLRDALRFACAASAISVGRRGASPSCPQRAEVDAFLAQHED